MLNVFKGRPYAHLELPYKHAFAGALAEDSNFSSWIIEKTTFSSFADARLMHREMLAKRSKSCRATGNWALSHYQERCRCDGCCGRETDLLAIFEHKDNVRFALHIEVKRPGDRFTGRKDQPSAYPKRAQCWVNKTPKMVLQHNLATTVLLFSELQAQEFSPHLDHFKTQLTFEQIETQFPNFFSKRRTD